MDRGVKKMVTVPNRWFDEAHSRAQIEGILRLLGPGPKTVLDLGCGDGRVLIPLANAGHDLVGVDHDSAALDGCRRNLAAAGVDARLIEDDFTVAVRGLSDRFDAVLCLGNTFMLIVGMDQAIALTRSIAQVLREGGVFIIDDFPHECWAEIAAGRWQTGVSEDGSEQLIFEPGDDVFVLRRGDEVDPDSWTPRPGDTRYRLWSMGALTLLAGAAGLSAPRHLPDDHLVLFQSAAAAASTPP